MSAPRKNATGAALPQAVPSKQRGSTTRLLTPLIPLAIAGAVTLSHSGQPTPAPAGPPAPLPAVVQTGGATVTGNSLAGLQCGGTGMAACPAPYPLLAKGHPVDWFFVFKMNSAAFPGCGDAAGRTCPFGGAINPDAHFSQHFAYASAEAPALQDGGQLCLGTTTNDPVGATFDEVYNGNYHYVVWNDQPYEDPKLQCGSSNSCSGPWGHSKGLLAWNDAGDGLVMQVSTPDWPLSGSAQHPRQTSGNTLGCIKDNDIEVSQHFFSLRLTKSDLVSVLQGLSNASVVTDPTNPQVVSVDGGPADLATLAKSLGVKSKNTAVQTATLSSGVELISKPSLLAVPPWQMVSSVLGGASLHVANWWITQDQLASTSAGTPPPSLCWSPALQAPGAVVNATSGTWNGVTIGLLGGPHPDGNHAKVAVTTSGEKYAIFGDMNQEGSYAGPDCTISQNGRGGTFYVVKNAQLAASVGSLIGAPAQ